MKTGLRHPLWTHLPVAAVLIALAVYTARVWPLPGRAAIHFDGSGLPNGYGSPWLALVLCFGLGLLFLAISVAVDELWARQESRKSFNWMSLFDEAVVAFLCAVAIGYLGYLEAGAERYGFPWSLTLLLVPGALLAAVALELARPFRGDAIGLPQYQSGELSPELKEQLRAASPFIFWSSQNPLYVTLLTTLLPLIMFASAALAYTTAPWATAELIVIGLLLFIPYGGLRVAVTRKDVTVRFGLFGLRVLRLRVGEIVSSEAVEFSPLRDFGGYGIRFNRGVSAYYLKGNRGVRLTMSSGKKYLLGADDAQLLAGIISALARPGGLQCPSGL